MLNFCTLFDLNYATRGLALYRSLERHCPGDFRLTILCVDQQTRDAIAKLTLAKAILVLPEDLGDSELLDLRATRPRREFCWTCVGPLMLFLLRQVSAGEIVTYLDADLAFYSDPAAVFEELGDKDILIHAHRFAPRYESYAAASGIFNVGLVAIRHATEGLACMERWRAQCIEICVLDPENGYCGDQKYLDEWPSLYNNLVVLQHPGAGLAPWNVESHKIAKSDGQVTVDGRPLVFYHYHALTVLLRSFLGRCIIRPSVGYEFPLNERRLLYRPYARMLREAQIELDRVVPPSPAPRTALRQLLSYAKVGQLVIG